jgi:Alpha/beta hydrolase domain
MIRKHVDELATRPRVVAGALLPLVLIASLVSLPTASFASPTAATKAEAEDTPVPAAALTEIEVPGTTPLGAAAVDLASLGYTEREFYADGVANRYAGADTGALQAAQVIDGDWPYRTRVLVRTPEPERFNGTLIVEWANVTIGQDGEFLFAEVYEHLLREGYAVAAVSAQRVGVEHLKRWSPERYGNLSVDVNACGTGGTSLCTGDPLSWDIMSQVSTALKNNAGDVGPLPGLEVQNVIAAGQSQSAGRLTVYYNTIQPLYGFFDGFVYEDQAGQLRSDRAVPGISVNSDAFAFGFPRTTSEYTRVWEVAGGTHASLYGSQYMDDVIIRDKSLLGPNGPISFTDWIEPSCVALPAFSTVDSGLVLNAAIESVREWILTGKAAAPSILFDRDHAGVPVRDADGNALGGVRLAQLTAPTAFLSPRNGTAFPCSVSGQHRYYTDEELKSLYGTHDNYVEQVRTTMHRAQKDGYLLKFDEKAAVEAAKDSNVAR